MVATALSSPVYMASRTPSSARFSSMLGSASSERRAAARRRNCDRVRSLLLMVLLESPSSWALASATAAAFSFSSFSSFSAKDFSSSAFSLAARARYSWSIFLYWASCSSYWVI